MKVEGDGRFGERWLGIEGEVYRFEEESDKF
jgi:hypothetical protein